MVNFMGNKYTTSPLEVLRGWLITFQANEKETTKCFMKLVSHIFMLLIVIA
jgi:hypothetical protein